MIFTKEISEIKKELLRSERSPSSKDDLIELVNLSILSFIDKTDLAYNSSILSKGKAFYLVLSTKGLKKPKRIKLFKITKISKKNVYNRSHKKINSQYKLKSLRQYINDEDLRIILEELSSR